MSYTPRPGAPPEERIAVMEQILCDLHTELIGNGQPGQLTKINSRLGILEHWQSRLQGVMLFVAGVGTLVGAFAGIMAIINAFKIHP